MKTINVFLASSEELDYSRMAFGNLVRRLDDIYEKRGVRVKLYEWEDYDAAYVNRRKQSVYSDHARECDMFIAMFGTLAKKFTLKGFDVALDEYGKRKAPKIYVYCKDLRKEKKKASKNLMSFQSRLSNEMGYYFCRYDSRESMQFHFVMQFQLLESGMIDGLKVEDGNVVLGNLQVARMDNLKFAAANEDYLEMGKELADLPSKIEEARLRLHEHPEDEDLVEDLQGKLDKYNDLKGRFEEHQQLLFQAAMRVAKLQGEVITERMRDAMNALDEGRVRDAIVILDLAEEDASRNLEEYRQSREMTEEKRQVVSCSIEELLLKASSVMADASITIEERILKADRIYAQADEMAFECEYDKNKYVDLLFEYGKFLEKYSYYDKALKVGLRLTQMCKDIYGHEHPFTASSYDEIGRVYKEQGHCSKALKYHQKSLKINIKTLGKEHPNTASSYNNLGIAYEGIGEYDKAIKNEQKAIDICENLFDLNHPYIGISYENIGGLFMKKGDFIKAYDYYLKANAIFEKVLGQEHPYTASSYDSIGLVNYEMGHYENAEDYFQKALDIYKNVLGLEHHLTASTLNNIGSLYWKTSNYAYALYYFQNAAAIREKVFGIENPYVATTYENIGSTYYQQGDYINALDYYLKALEIHEKLLGFEHPIVATSYNNIGAVFYAIGEYESAIKFYLKDIAICEKVFGECHPDIAISYNNIGNAYMNQNNFEMALKYHLKALAIKKKTLGIEHPSTATSYNIISDIKIKLRDKGSGVF